MAARSILDNLKDISLDNLKNNIKRGLTSASEAPRAIYNNFTNKISTPSQEKEYVDNSLPNSPVMSLKGYTPTELNNRSYQVKDPEKFDDFVKGMAAREDLKRGFTPTEVQNRFNLGQKFSKDPKGFDDYMQGMLKRRELMKNQNECLLSLAVAKQLGIL